MAIEKKKRKIKKKIDMYLPAANELFNSVYSTINTYTASIISRELGYPPVKATVLVDKHPRLLRRRYPFKYGPILPQEEANRINLLLNNETIRLIEERRLRVRLTPREDTRPKEREMKFILKLAAQIIPMCPICNGVLLSDVDAAGFDWKEVKHLVRLCSGGDLRAHSIAARNYGTTSKLPNISNLEGDEPEEE